MHLIEMMLQTTNLVQRETHGRLKTMIMFHICVMEQINFILSVTCCELFLLPTVFGFRGLLSFTCRTMPPNCSVKSCSTKHSDTRKFFKYPKDELLANKWILFAQQGNNWKPTSRSVICSKHFNPALMNPRTGRLYPNAIPGQKERGRERDRNRERSIYI